MSYAKPQLRSADDTTAIALLRGSNIQRGHVDESDLAYVDQSCVSRDQFLQAKDVVLTMSSGSISLIGKSAWVPNKLERTTFGAFCGVIRSFDIDARWLFFFMQTDHYRRYIQKLAKGTNINNLKREHLVGLAVPVPPVNVQPQLVAAVDRLFTEVDDGEAALERARGDLATWRKALLKAAVTGELTADWRAANPPAESGADLLARILAEPTAACDAGHLTVNLPPDGWTSVQLGQVASLQGGFAFKSEHYTSDGIFLIRIGDIRRGDIVPTSSSARVPIETSSSANSFRVYHNDLLIAMSGATTAKFGRYRSNEPALLNQRVGRFRVNEKYLNSDFLALWLGLWKASILEAAYGGAQPNISSRQIEAMAVLLPPTLEQDELVSRLVEPLNIADEYEDTLIASQLDAATLRQSILAAAFRGELVA